MLNLRKWFGFLCVLSIAMFFVTSNSFALDVTDDLTIGGVLSGAYQHQNVNDAPGFNDTGKGAVVFKPEISFTPTEHDEVYAQLGFASGNGLNDGSSPFALAPWASDMEEDMININGRNRNTLLTAWYKHIFKFTENNALAVTGGIIDAAAYLDDNAYANDEYAQFMNGALVNGPNTFLPSYDIGGALEWGIGALSLKGVVMQIGENDESRAYNYYGAQIGYAITSGLGEGTYRILVDTTSEDFSNPEEDKTEAHMRIIFSFDQELGDILGAWIRCGWQDDKAAVDYKNLYSGGIDINGQLWGRKDDNIGIGYAYLNDGNGNIDSSQVFETYARFQLNAFLAVTADVQYLSDDYKEGDNDPNGLVYGARLTAEF